MFIIVTGGSGSGKSAFAEKVITELGEGKRIYIATMMCFDEEGKKRIQRHREMRSEKNFETVERYTDLENLTLPQDSIVLLECMSNLTANEMFDLSGAGVHTPETIMKGIHHLLSQVRHLVVVTNEIFSDGVVYDPETVRYQQYLGEINCHMAKIADQVYEVVYGIPLCLKGEDSL